MKSRWLRGKLK